MKHVARIVVLIALTVFSSGVAEANSVSDFAQDLKDLKWEDGRLRIEGQAWTGTRSGRRSRSDDFSVVGTVEKEFDLGHRLTVGVRAIPLFYYDEHRSDEEIWAAGGGVSLRWYTHDAMDGWFVEYSESLVAQSDKFRGNSGSLNFMSEVGLGYEFNNNWHIAAKWRHLSNAGIANRNSGVNGVGVAVGFSF
jgi:hypothetical protein